MTRLRLVVPVLALLLAPASAPADELRDVVLRGHLALTYSTGSPVDLRSDDAEPRVVSVDLAEGFGGGFNLEYRTSPRWGVLLDLLWTGYAMTLEDTTFPERPVATENRYNIYPLLAGPVLHLTRPHGAVDVYVGALAGWVNHAPANLSDPRNSTTSVSDDFGFAGLVGLDWNQGEYGMWFWTFGLRVLTTTTRITVEADDGSRNSADYSVHPVSLTVGAGFRLF